MLSEDTAISPIKAFYISTTVFYSIVIHYPAYSSLHYWVHRGGVILVDIYSRSLLKGCILMTHSIIIVWSWDLPVSSAFADVC